MYKLCALFLVVLISFSLISVITEPFTLSISIPSIAVMAEQNTQTVFGDIQVFDIWNGVKTKVRL